MSHLTAAIDRHVFQDALDVLRDILELKWQGTTTGKNYELDYDIELELRKGDIIFDSPENEIELRELDVFFKKFDCRLRVNIPSIKLIDEKCISVKPAVTAVERFLERFFPFDFGASDHFADCTIRTNPVYIFKDQWDLDTSFSLANNTSELSFQISPQMHYVTPRHIPFTPQLPLAPWLEQLLRIYPNRPEWRLYLFVTGWDLDISDLAANVETVLNAAIENYIADYIDSLPTHIQPLAEQALADSVQMVHDIVDIPDDFEEWAGDLLNTGIGIRDFVTQHIINIYQFFNPLAIPTPYPILEKDANNRAVTVPIASMESRVEDSETLVIVGNFGQRSTTP